MSQKSKVYHFFWKINFSLNRLNTGTSLVVQWLRLHFHCTMAMVGSLVHELKYHIPQGTVNSKKKKIQWIY